jgi:hypothetical protein
MGKFVNYKKRSIALPPGCKDLVDVLWKASHHKSSDPIAARWVPVPKPERIATNGQDHIPRFMTRVLESTTKFTSLSIELPGKDVAIGVYRHSEARTLHLTLVVSRDTEMERATRDCFSGHHIAPTADYLPLPLTPTSVCTLQYPLPQDATAAANLIGSFLRTVCGLPAEAGIDFTFDNHEETA